MNGDTEGWSIAAFTLAILGLLGAASAPVAVYDVTTTAGDVDDVLPGIAGAFAALVAVPLVAIVFAEIGKRKVLKSEDLRGFGLAHAAHILSMLAVVGVVVWAAIITLAYYEERDEQDAAEAGNSLEVSATEVAVEAPPGDTRIQPGEPWQLQLADGDICGFVGGATGTAPNGERASYNCEGDRWIVGDVDTDPDVWVVQRWERGATTIEEIEVVSARVNA